MDDRGFIFTADATLALVVVIVFTASLVVYALLPVYQGQDHQHLQALADSALATMEEDGTLRDAAVYYANNNSTAAQYLLTTSLNSILPSDVSYKMTMNGYTPEAINTRGRDYAVSTDVATGVRVISGPREGWLGRSFYNIKEVGLSRQDTNVTTTLWNFHNWLTNFSPWNTYGLNNRPYWGYQGGYYGGTYRDIAFSVPNSTTGTVNWARFIINSANKNYGNAYSAGVSINNHNYQVQQSQFQNLYSYSNYRFYNYPTLINTNDLTPGTQNNLHVSYGNVDHYSDMAWFSLIANYTVSMVVPQGVVTKNFYFPDSAGAAYPYNRLTDRNRRVSGISYSFNGGSVPFTRVPNKIYSWADYKNNHNYGLENSIPFVLRSPPGNSAASAVAIQKDIDNTDAGTIKDAYVTLNPYGAVDGAMVEVYRPQYNRWDTVFQSDVNTAEHGTDFGYGNLPGTINLKDYMDKGQINKVRITVWDDVPSQGGSDYDFVGLTNCYAVVSSSKLPVQWDEYATESDQSSTNQIQKSITYNIGSNNTKEAYLFFSGGLDTKNVRVAYDSGELLYNGAAPYLLNLGELDAAGPHKMTNGTVSNHTYIPANYTIRVTVTSGEGWESGDSYAEIFSGTRVAVIYPALEHAVWSTSYASTAQQAIDQAYQILVDNLHDQGFDTLDPNLVYNESMYTGDLPNSIPVRLDLWTH